MPLPVIPAIVGTLGAGALFRVSVAWFIANIACRLIFRTLFSLGIGVIAFAGSDILLDPVADQLQSYLSALDVNIRGLFRICRVHEGIGIIFAAGTYAAVFRFASTTIGYQGRKPTAASLERIWK